MKFGKNVKESNVGIVPQKERENVEKDKQKEDKDKQKKAEKNRQRELKKSERLQRRKQNKVEQINKKQESTKEKHSSAKEKIHFPKLNLKKKDTKEIKEDAQRIREEAEQNIKQRKTKIKQKKEKIKEYVPKNIVPPYRSIKTKLIITVMLPVAAIIILGILSYSKASSGIISSYKNSSLQALEVTGDYFTFVFQNMQKEYNDVVGMTDIDSYARGELNSFITKRDTVYNTYYSMFNQNLTGDRFAKSIYILVDGNVPIATELIDDTDTYSVFIQDEKTKEAVENPDNYYWIGAMPELDDKLYEDTSKYALRMLRKYKKSNAMLVVDLKRDAILEILNGLYMGEGSTLAMVTKDGYEIVSDVIDEEGNIMDPITLEDGTELNRGERQNVVFTDKDFYQEAVASEETSCVKSVNYGGKKQMFFCAKIGDSGVMLCGLIPQSTITKQAEDIRNVTIILVVIASIISAAVGLIFAAGMGNVINMMLGKLSLASEGDLTVKINSKRKDEFGVLADGLNHMIGHTKHLIQKVETVSGSLGHVAGAVEESSGDFVQSAKGIKASVSEIEQGTFQQANDAVQCLEKMDSLSGAIETVGKNAQTMNQIAEKTEEAIGRGIVSMGELNQKTKSTTEVTGAVIENVQSLEEKSRSIGKIIEVINEIASQTNLLSLNASIEAARAGEAGKGFSVVATEIRNLADQSQASANQIKAIVEEIGLKTREVVQTAKKADNIVKEQVVAVERTTESFDEMDKQVGNLMKQLEEILTNVEQMDETRNITLEAIESISSVSEQTASCASSVAENAEKQLEVVQGLESNSRELISEAGELGEAIKQFKVH